MRGQNALTHNQANALLGDYIANELPEQTRLLVEQHLSTCELCQANYAEIYQIGQLLGTLKVPVEKNSSSLADVVLTQLTMAPTSASEDLDALLADTTDEFSTLQESGENRRPLFSAPGVLTTESASNAQNQQGQKKKYTHMNKQRKSYANERMSPMESRTRAVNKTKMNTIWLTLVAVLVLAIISGSLFAFRSALFGDHNSGPTRPAIATPVPGSTPTAVPSTPTAVPSTPTMVIPQTVPMPQTDTSCPAADTTRAAEMRPLALGKDQNIVYTDNLMLKRYDVQTKVTTTILNFPIHNVLSEAQVSSDGLCSVSLIHVQMLSTAR